MNRFSMYKKEEDKLHIKVALLSFIEYHKNEIACTIKAVALYHQLTWT